MTRLRGHHLICLNFFKGEGYSEEFVEAVKEAVSSEKVVVVSGGDDVCETCPSWENECKAYGEDYIRRIDELALSLLEVNEGEEVSWKEIRERLKSAMKTWRREVCSECEWLRVCKETEIWKSI